MNRPGVSRKEEGIAGQCPEPVLGDEQRLLAFPTPSSGEMPPVQYISDAEIVQLVCVAIDDALAALNAPDPENCLRLRAYDARAAIREWFPSASRGIRGDRRAVQDYRRAMMLQNLSLDLALNLVASVRRHAKVYEREIPPGAA